MFLLHIDAKLKPGRQDEFLHIFNGRVLPLLKKQNGFIDEMLLFEKGTNTGIALSFWKSRKDAEQYQQDVFEKAKNHVEYMIDGPITVRSFEVVASDTFQIRSRQEAA
jgi:heme-degrading monooxygenase HmoA